MFNLIKMDFYRLFCMKSFWVMILVTIGLAFFSVWMTDVDLNWMKEGVHTVQLEEDQSEAEDGEVDIAFGIYTQTDPKWMYGDIPFSDLTIEAFRSCILLLLCAIFVPLFVNAENKSGYIKNIAGQLPGKGMLVIPKLVAAAVQVFLILAIFSIFTGIAGLAFWGGRVVFGSLSDFAIGFGLQFLLHYSFAVVMLMFTILFKNSGFSMCLGILCAMGMLATILGFVNQLLISIDGLKKLNLIKYVIETNVQNVTNHLEQTAVNRCVAISLVYIVLAAVLSVTVMQKRDV